jgi:hypothetical protein
MILVINDPKEGITCLFCSLSHGHRHHHGQDHNRLMKTLELKNLPHVRSFPYMSTWPLTKLMYLLQANALWDGMVKAFKFIGTAQQLPADAFAEAFRLLSGSVKEADIKAARQLLKQFISTMEKYITDCASALSAEEEAGREITKQQEFISYIVHACGNLPFYTLDGPLYMMNAINQLVSAMGGRCLDELKAAASGNIAADPPAFVLCREGHCMGLLLSLSVQIQKSYHLKADRIRKFDPGSLDKNVVQDKDTSTSVAALAELFKDQSVIKSDVERLFKLLNSSMCGALSNEHADKTDTRGTEEVDWDEVMGEAHGTSATKSAGRKRAQSDGGKEAAKSKAKRAKTASDKHLDGGKGKKNKLKTENDDGDFSPVGKGGEKAGSSSTGGTAPRAARSSKNKRKLVDSGSDDDE